jgi:Aspartate/tyrosine/aromatic aminotransferase
MAVKLSKRVNCVGDSATIRLNDVANRLRMDGKDVINLGVGEPDFDTPLFIREAAKRAIDDGDTHYAPSLGKQRLREDIADKLREDNRIDASPKNIIVSAGAKHIIFMAINALLDGGEEAMLFCPAWVSYEACIKLAGGRVNWVKTKEEDAFQPSDLQDKINKKTKLLVVNSPNNPTGSVYKKDTLKMIRDLAIDRDLYVISDEIYEKIIYEADHISLASFDGMAERTITVNGFSKSYAMTGWRLGYACAPKEIIGGMLKIQQHSVTCAASFSQEAAIKAMEGPQDDLKRMVEEFKRRRDILIEGLNSIGIRCVRPAGAFYTFVDVSKFGGDSNAFCEKMLREGYVVMIPGYAFGPGWEKYVRISYAAPLEKIEEALLRMEKIFALGKQK